MLAVLIICAAVLIPSLAAADAIPVKVERTKQGWQLLRGGKPYSIRGAGGDASLQMLAAAGANSVRTWGADDLDALAPRRAGQVAQFDAHRTGEEASSGLDELSEQICRRRSALDVALVEEAVNADLDSVLRQPEYCLLTSP